MSLARQLDFLTRLVSTRRQEPAQKQPAIPAAADRNAELEAKARELLRALHCDDLAKRVVVRWNPRMRSTAGSAFVTKALITLNPRLR